VLKVPSEQRARLVLKVPSEQRERLVLKVPSEQLAPSVQQVQQALPEQQAHQVVGTPRKPYDQ
jgi:hypothetical protein